MKIQGIEYKYLPIFALIIGIIISGSDCQQPPDDPYLSLGHYFVEYQHQIDNVDGLETEIVNYYGGLFGEPDSTFESFSQADCAIFKYQDDIHMWAQVGLGKFRIDGQQYVHKGFRAEVKGALEDGTIYWDTKTSFGGVNPPEPPADGDTVSLCLQLDIGTGYWTIDANDTTFYFANIYSWLMPGTHVGWEGEVTHVENYMPGTSTNFTVFQGLRCRTGSNDDYGPVYHAIDDYCRSDNEALWGIDPQYDMSHILEIWIFDKRVL